MHTIVYLDQNYISNMAKARHGLIEDKGEATFWNSLFDELEEAVIADKIACPKLEFHDIESVYDTRVEEPILEVIGELSQGLEFHEWETIADLQIEDAARRYLGKPEGERHPWVMAFKSDPHATIESRIQGISNTKGRLNVFIPLSDDDVERKRQRKAGFVDIAHSLLDKDTWKHLTWSELVFESKKSVLSGLMGEVARQYNRHGLQGLYDTLFAIGITDETVMKFAYSDELFGIPFVDIFGSIWAAIARSYIQDREVSKSDNNDVGILSTALIYCDVMTTDKFMKGIIVNRLNFDEKYDAKVFSGTGKDRLAFQGFMCELTK